MCSCRDLGPPWVGDRVVCRWCLGQAGQHRRLGHRDVVQRLAEVDLAGGGKPVGALPQVDLVHVDLENLLLRQLVLDLQGQQDLVDLAGEGLLGRQIEVARQLHRDGRCALALELAQAGQAGAQHALVVDTPVLVEVRVLDRQHGVFHHLGDLADRGELATLLAEFAQQHPVGRQHAQRQLGPVVAQAGDVGQVGVGHRQRQDHQRRRAGQRGQRQPHGPERHTR